MDGGAAAIGGGPAPFLLKTYEMVDDSSTDAIVSWSGSKKSFIVWDPPEFARILLPSYFKHNNFSSFIRQLNTYGFKKIDPERWEFANDDFVKDQKHLLKNIYRRKPIHSHSQQPQVSIDLERAAYEAEIDNLSREKGVLEGKVLKYVEQQSVTRAQLENLIQRVASMEQRQEKLLSFLDKAVRNPDFVEKLALKLESMDFSPYNKKRRIPQVENAQQDLCDTLRLELLPAVSDVNVVSIGMISSNEDGASSQWRQETVSKDIHGKTADFGTASEIIDLSDSGTSFNLNADSPSSEKVGSDSPKASIDEGRGDHLSCLLDLTLASSSVELSRSQNYTQSSPDIPTAPTLDSNFEANGRQDARPDNTRILFSSSDAQTNKLPAPAPAPVPTRVNDHFWEQFLTERPGCSDNEEATLSHGHLTNYNSRMERLTL